jgi:hypothetical protein
MILGQHFACHLCKNTTPATSRSDTVFEQPHYDVLEIEKFW